MAKKKFSEGSEGSTDKAAQGRSVSEVIAGLATFVPEPVGGANTLLLYEILDGFGGMPCRERAVPMMFSIMERFPDADLGHPGPLVHELEGIPGTQDALIASIRRCPSYYTVWMLNRALNVRQSEEERGSFMETLRWVASNEEVDTALTDLAKDYLDNQEAASKGRPRD